MDQKQQDSMNQSVHRLALKFSELESRRDLFQDEYRMATLVNGSDVLKLRYRGGDTCILVQYLVLPQQELLC